MKLGNLQRITIDDIKNHPDEVVRKFNENLDRLELALNQNLDGYNFSGKTIPLVVVNGTALFVPFTGNIAGVTFKKVVPQPLLPGSFSLPNTYWYPSPGGFYVVCSWTVPSNQPIVQKANISVYVETL